MNCHHDTFPATGFTRFAGRQMADTFNMELPKDEIGRKQVTAVLQSEDRAVNPGNVSCEEAALTDPQFVIDTVLVRCRPVDA